MKRIWVSLMLLALTIALPIVLRRGAAVVPPQRADDRIIILTPHNETIRREFARAFADWWKARTGRTIYVDWRTPGGASEIRMVIDDGFKAAEQTGRDGIGVDVLFGGGEHDFSSLARQCRLRVLEVFTRHPEVFGEGKAVPQWHGGERYFPDDHTWVATCLAQFGICYNLDVLERLHMPPLESWNDLSDPRLANAVVLGDPTKSGSLARAFELVVQEHMQRALAEQRSAAEGWEEGLRAVMKMSANARYFTDSASKIPHDVSQGNAAAGMSIDFYGRSYQEITERASKEAPRFRWIAPRGGSSFGADPVAVLQGAPSPEIAQAFVEFCLSIDGQLLWSGKPGSPHGPRRRALHRVPVRRDVFTPEYRTQSTMPEVDPYDAENAFTYRKDLTGPAFNTLRALVKIICIDSHDELSGAWRALRDAGFPEDAMAVCFDLGEVNYARMGKGDDVLNGGDALAISRRSTELGERFRANFKRAEAMAKSRKR